MKTKSALLATFMLLTLSFGTQAALIEQGFPPPGGVDYSASGTSPGHVGGRTWHFSNFDDTAYDELYYAVKDPLMGEQPGAGVVALTYNAGASDLANGISVWENSFEFYNAQTGSNETVSGAFTLTVTDSLGGSLALTDATSLGLDANLGGMLMVEGDFNANWQFEINGQEALVWYDNASNLPGNQLQTSVGGSFFVSEVPLPGAAWLFLSAISGLAAWGRKAV